MNADAGVYHIYHRLRVSGLLYIGELNDGQWLAEQESNESLFEE